MYLRRASRSVIVFGAMLGVVLGIARGGGSVAGAQTLAPTAVIQVNTTSGVVNNSDGLCTLREAITAANTNAPSGSGTGECAAGAGADTIVLGAGTYLISAVDNTTDGENGLPIITSPITIQGTSIDTTVIQRAEDQGTPFFRLIYVGAQGYLTLDNLMVRGGMFLSPDMVLGGGGILNRGTLVLQESAVVSNTVGMGGAGGGILNFGDLSLSESIVSGNTGGNGGGIASYGQSVFLTDSTISGNNGGYATEGHGGGIYNPGPGTLTLLRSTVARNHVSAYAADGGGLSGSASIINSTISTNTVSGRATIGGGISVSGTVQLINSTIVGNDVTGFVSQSGAGIAGSASVRNTIIANRPSLNCTVPLSSAGHNLDSGTTCGLTATGDLSNTDPHLSPLGWYNGRTETHRPLIGSPVIDAGTNMGCPVDDQGGVSRPLDGDRDGPAFCDIGAVEAPVCANFDNNPLVTVVDVQSVAQNWGQAGSVIYNLNGDAIVDLLDIMIGSSQFGQSCS